MKNNNNSKSNFSIANIIVLIFSLVGMMVIINWISEKLSTWLADLLFPEEKKEDQKSKTSKIEALKPLLKEAIKKADHMSLNDIEKSTTIEVVDKDQVPENIREKIESNEKAKASGIKTFINGKNINIITALTGANKIDQFIYDCKELKRSKIGSHRIPDDSVTSHWDKCYAKLIKKNLTQAEKDWAKSFEADGFTRSRALEFTNKYFTEVNNYIRHFNVNIKKVSFEETDEIINKYFGEV